MLSMIFACDEEGAIGKDGDLPWRQSSDLQFFKRTTLNKPVVMGRKTWDSLGRALPKRRNIVMTRSGLDAEVETMSFDEVMALANEEEVMVIGGGEIYKLALPYADTIYLTEVNASLNGHAYFPIFDKKTFKETLRSHHTRDERHHYSFDYVTYERKKEKINGFS